MFQVNVVEKIKIHVLRSVTFFRKSCRLWDNVEKSGGAREAADGNMAAHGILVSMATDASSPQRPCTHNHTHTHKYVILTAFPRQQWFRERASLLCYTYIACIILLLWCVVPFMDHGLPRPGFRNVRNLSPTPDPQPGGSEYVSPEWLAPTAARLESIWFQSSLVHATPSPCWVCLQFGAR